MRPNEDPPPKRSGSDGFCTTRWSLVLRAKEDGPASGDALEELCRSYWYPLYGFARRRGAQPMDAEDLTQAFFVAFLEKQYLHRADSERGRFRSFLLVSFKHFLLNERRREQAIRRGGDKERIPLDGVAEALFVAQDNHVGTEEELYYRDWATTIFQRALARLCEAYRKEGKAVLFENLSGRLWGDAEGPSNLSLAERLGLTEAALKMATSRMRRRFREALRSEVTDTVNDPEEVDDEVRYLIAVLSR